MKNLTKLFLLAMLVVFASCQNETVTEDTSALSEEEVMENELAQEDEILVSDGEEDETFVLNNDLSTDMPAQDLSFSLASNSYSEGSSKCEADLDALKLSLPETVTVTTKDPECSPTGGAFIGLDITEGPLAGLDYDAYCIDLEGFIDISTYTFDVYSSYDETLSGLEQSPGVPLFENADVFGKINYILNQDIIGTESPLGGTYTFGHVQWAIWELIEGTGNNCTNDCDYLSCNPINQWDNDKTYNESLGLEIVALAEGQENFVPECGQKVAVVLASTVQQSLIISVDVPEKEEVCSDCEGEVTQLELEFDWHRAKKVDIVQRYEGTRYGKRVYCNRSVQPGEVINISGTNRDGTFGKYIYIYINNCYYTKIRTNCDTKIGPGYYRGVFNVVSGKSSKGGELCEFVESTHYKCVRYW
ncbi:hypothetical protein [Algibacter pectinivorans]|uniref:Uncharacterized protein n=1 Tax=Algibacter pectinivorans TaxID=870482 RepID=A0A1I1PB47_9FLAO|nr:hypothetical protein [Algibacter pectinivorans]SFD07019.1 hypothetical protein SAMN04487987_103347 [Algibacter pectinivorans]